MKMKHQFVASKNDGRKKKSNTKTHNDFSPKKYLSVTNSHQKIQHLLANDTSYIKIIQTGATQFQNKSSSKTQLKIFRSCQSCKAFERTLKVRGSPRLCGDHTGFTTGRSGVQNPLEEEKFSPFRFFFWKEPFNPSLALERTFNSPS